MSCPHVHKDAPDNAICEDCYFEASYGEYLSSQYSYDNDPHRELQEEFKN